jgi:hypothetical protein
VAKATPAASPSQAATTAAACQPLSRTGQCYNVGDSCPAADHNQSGTDAKGNVITCVNNHGWHWQNT